MSCGEMYIPRLRGGGFRITSQRMAILHVLHHAGTHLSPTQVFRLASKERPGLTEPTVYRTLEFLAQNGILEVAYTRNGHTAYQIAGEPHDHLVCRVCGRQIEVDHGLLERVYRTLESNTGYRSIDSHLTFRGVCPTCQIRLSREQEA
jgi:Fe2+ or Zn2+ uptake regulation protein